MRDRFGLAAVVLAVALLAVACGSTSAGSGGGTSSAVPTSPSTSAPTESVTTVPGTTVPGTTTGPSAGLDFSALVGHSWSGTGAAGFTPHQPGGASTIAVTVRFSGTTATVEKSSAEMICRPAALQSGTGSDTRQWTAYDRGSPDSFQTSVTVYVKGDHFVATVSCSRFGTASTALQWIASAAILTKTG